MMLVGRYSSKSKFLLGEGGALSSLGICFLLFEFLRRTHTSLNHSISMTRNRLVDGDNHALLCGIRRSD